MQNEPSHFPTKPSHISPFVRDQVPFTRAMFPFGPIRFGINNKKLNEVQLLSLGRGPFPLTAKN
jgi:hypothetical protein